MSIIRTQYIIYDTCLVSHWKLLNYSFFFVAPPDAPFLNQPLLICTAHLHWDPEFCDVKLIQTMMLSNELKTILEESAETLKAHNIHTDASNIQLVSIL